jgi:hypothetical protein
MDRIIFTDQKPWAMTNSPEALADAIEGKFTPDLRASGLRASEEARQRYSWNTVFTRMMSFYSDVVLRYDP